VLYNQTSDNYGECIFSVRDTGVGVPPEHQQRIFEAFTQEDSSTTRKYGGTGLGLTISNKILNIMDSKLELESNSGGSRFFFSIQTTIEYAPLFPPLESLPPIKKVLVIDDNANNRLILEKMLHFIGVSVVAAANGINGLEILHNDTSIDALILDYHMPFMDGLEVMHIIREELRLSASKLPILFLHSSSDTEFIYQQCQKYNVGIKLTKPVRMRQLFNSIHYIQTQPEQYIAFVSHTTSESASQTHRSNTIRKVLIVEDNATNSLLAKTIVKNVDPECIILQAWNGKEGVEITQQEHPHLIFMDIHMPVMNGYAAVRAIREYEKEKKLLPTPIIALTAATVEGEQERCLEAGMNGYTTKPIVAESIREMMVRFLPH
jgi:CheY-like chemotaxis protein